MDKRASSSAQRPVLVSGSDSLSQFSKTYRPTNHLLQKLIHVLNRKIIKNEHQDYFSILKTFSADQSFGKPVAKPHSCPQPSTS